MIRSAAEYLRKVESRQVEPREETKRLLALDLKAEKKAARKAQREARKAAKHAAR